MYTFSREHNEYLKRIRKRKILVILFQIFIFLMFISIWELLAHYSIINTFLYSSPSRIINTIYSLMMNGLLWKSIGITVLEVFISFSLTTFVGILCAFLFWKFELISRILDPYITILNSLPKVALGPLIIIWYGAGMKSIIIMALLISVFNAIIHIYSGFISTPSHYLLLLNSFHANSFQIFFKLVLPYNLDTIIATLKTNISLSFIGVIMGELLVSKSGVGYLIMYGSQVFQLDLVITGIFILGILAYLFYYIIDHLLDIIKKEKK